MRSKGPRYHSNRTPDDDTDANERDVIMGRGKRVSEWPGNIYFRQVVNEHRDAYQLAYRTTKVTIALDVIDKIHKNGGRFMTETPDQKWVEVSQERAIEKCCQALREKEKPNPPEGDPFVPVGKKKSSSKTPSSSRAGTKASRAKTVPKNSGKAKPSGSRKTPASSSTSKKRKKISEKRPREEEDDSDVSEDSSSSGEDDSSSGEESGSSDDNSSSGSSTSSDGSSIVRLRKKQKIARQSAATAAAVAASKKDTDDKKKKNGNKKKADDKDKDGTSSLMDSPVNRVRFSQHGEMLKRLESFVKVAGHCAVPPDWESDPLLADWCTLQRQNYRNQQTEYVDPTEIDDNVKDLVKRLEELNFVWDYDSWHWQHQFDKFIESYNKKDDSSQGDVENLEWLEDQRRQWVENKANLTSERVEMLKEAGISLA